MFEAYAKYGKRNWRRVKREVNKAVKRIKRKLRING
jgi:hypothetical protein